MRRRLTLFIASLLALALVGGALATLPSAFTATTFVRATIGANKKHQGIKAYAGHVKLHTKGATDVTMQTITIAPGGSSGWHSHPGIVLVAVQSGALTRYDEHCRTTPYGAGSGFVEFGNHPALVRNNSGAPVVLYVTYISPKTATALRIDKPQPATCSAS
ncbi:MAG: cupin domain-containing protein [Actinobacteria bacterium]|nr:cupin domain-containing protein [Actinomycetota bacterium]